VETVLSPRYLPGIRWTRGASPRAAILRIALLRPPTEIEDMDNPPVPQPARRFSETDTDAILRRTAELASGAEDTPVQRGLTVEEMEALVGEAGLDPELVRRAAREVTLRLSQEFSPWTGAPGRILLERVIPGELSEEVWESMVGEIQRSFGALGYASRVGRTRTWTVPPTGGHGRVLSVTATTQQGQTILRVDESLSSLVGQLFGGLIGGLGGGLVGVWMGIGMGIFHSPAVAGALVITGVAGSYVLARALFRRAFTRRSRELGDLLDRLAAAGPAER
jgi:hypothetical protein